MGVISSSKPTFDLNANVIKDARNTENRIVEPALGQVICSVQESLREGEQVGRRMETKQCLEYWNYGKGQPTEFVEELLPNPQ